MRSVAIAPADAVGAAPARIASFPVWVLCTAVLAVTACGGSAPSVPTRGDRVVNIVIYVIDTLRRDRLGVYGYERDTSPHIDALAAEGVVFDEAYAPAPWTLPSVVSMMTSQFPVDHRVLFTGQEVLPRIEILPERLHELGYRTAGFVMNPHAGDYAGLRQGYDHYRVLAGAAYVARWLDEIAAAGGGPLFIYVHTTEPHRPLRAPASFVQRFGQVSAGVRDRINRQTVAHLDLLRADFSRGLAPGTTDNSARQQAVVQSLERAARDVEVLYDASVAWADSNLGALVSALRARGLWEDTLFLLVSDHGEEFFEHGSIGHGQSVYGELVRIPMIWRFPGAQAAGRRVSRPATLVDVLPTLLSYLEHPELAEDALGRNLLEALRDEAPAASAAVTSMRFNRNLYYRPAKERRGDVNLSVAEGHWKGIWNVEIGSFELYDTAEDPGERRDVAAIHPEVAKRLRAAAESWLAERPAAEAPVGEPPALEPLDAGTHERLRELGYME